MSEQASTAPSSASAPQASTGAPNVQSAPAADPNLGKPKSKLGSRQARAEMIRRAGEISAERKGANAAARPQGGAPAAAPGAPAPAAASSGAGGAEQQGAAADPPKPSPMATAAEKADYAQQLARARRAASEENRKRLDAEKRLKEYEGKANRATELESQVDTWKKDPRKAYQDLGLDIRPIVEGINNGDFKPPTSQEREFLDLKQRFEAAEAAREASERKATELERQQSKYSRVGRLSEELKAAAEHFPALSILPWGAQSIIDAAGDDENANLGEIARGIEASVMGNFKAMIGAPGIMKVALQDPAIKKQVLEVLGLGTTNDSIPDVTTQPDQQASSRSPVPGNGPRTITNAQSAATGDRGKRPSENQRRSALTEAVRTRFASAR